MQHKSPPNLRWTPEKLAILLADRRDGIQLKPMAANHGVSVERIRQCLRKAERQEMRAEALRRNPDLYGEKSDGA